MPRRHWGSRRAGPFGIARFLFVMGAQIAVLAVAFVGVVAAGVGGAPGVDAALAAPLPDDTLVFDRTGEVLLADLHPPGYQHYQRPLEADLVVVGLSAHRFPRSITTRLVRLGRWPVVVVP